MPLLLQLSDLAAHLDHIGALFVEGGHQLLLGFEESV